MWRIASKKTNDGIDFCVEIGPDSAIKEMQPTGDWIRLREKIPTSNCTIRGQNVLGIVLFHNDFSFSGEQPEQCILAHKL